MPEAVPPAFDSLCAAPKSVNETIDSETVALVRKVNDMLAAPPPPSLPPMEAARRAASDCIGKQRRLPDSGAVPALSHA